MNLHAHTLSIRRWIPVWLGALVLAESAIAVEVQPGVLYSGTTRVEASEYGVAFSVPPGWKGAWPAGSQFFLMQPEDPEVYLLAVAEEATRQQVVAMLGEKLDVGDGVQLRPAGPVAGDGNVLTAAYRVEGAATPMEARARAVVGDHGVAVAFILIAPPDRLARHAATLETVAGGATLGPPVRGAQGAAGGGSAAGGDRWDEYIKGKYLVRYYTASGFTDEQHLWLCSDGTFLRRGASGGFGGGASGAFQADSTGRWQATGAGARGTLTLTYGDGSVARHDLSYDYDEDKLYVDGKRWLRGTNERCR